MFEVERLTQAVRASGVTMSTSEETLFADLQALGRRYAKIRIHPTSADTGSNT